MCLSTFHEKKYGKKSGKSRFTKYPLFLYHPPFARSLRCGSALSPLKELRQFEMRLCAVQNKSRPGHVEYDEERES